MPVDPQKQFWEFQLCWGTCSPRRELRFELLGRSLARLEVESGHFSRGNSFCQKWWQAGLKPKFSFSWNFLQTFLGFFLLPCTTLCQRILWANKSKKKPKDKILNWNYVLNAISNCSFLKFWWRMLAILAHLKLLYSECHDQARKWIKIFLIFFGGHFLDFGAIFG